MTFLGSNLQNYPELLQVVTGSGMHGEAGEQFEYSM